jgi:C4-dicarboxylate transporter DctM subunit
MTGAIVALVVILFLLLLSSAPIAIALGLTSFVYFYYFTTIPLTQVPERLFNSLNSFPLMAIPFFVLAASIMSRGGISRRLIAAGNAIVGEIRGGLAATAVLSCMFFAAISGSSPATVVAVGTLIIPAMVNSGYGKKFSTGLVATSGSLGILIPPSIPLIVYGIATEESIGDLFIAGIVPGIMAGFMLLLLVFVISRRRNLGAVDESQRMTRVEKLRALRDAVLSLALPGVVLGGIYGGVFTPTEAAAVAVAYALILAMGVYRELSIKDLGAVLLTSTRTSAMVMFIIANGILFSFVLTSERIPGQITELHGDLERDPHPRADPPADRRAVGHQPHPPRGDHGDEPGDRHGDAPTGAEPLRRKWHLQAQRSAGRPGLPAQCGGAAGGARTGDLRARHLAGGARPVSRRGALLSRGAGHPRDR